MANENDELIKKLKYCSPYIEARREEVQIVDDVMARQVLNVSAGKVRNTGVEALQQMPQDATPEQRTAIEIYSGKRKEQCRYLPQGGAESAWEYESRLSMTPDFYETPGILNDRQGALFSQPPKLEGTEAKAYADFENEATVDGRSLAWVIGQVSDWMQRHGVCGLLVDRETVAPEIVAKAEAGQFSEAEKEELKPGRSIVALYDIHHICDYAFDKRGLLFVKVCEEDNSAATWDGKGKSAKIYRVIDREQIRSWRITKDDQDNEQVEELPAVKHEAVNDRGEAICPFFLFASPIDVRKGIGASTLLACAKADVAAIRTMSDIVWSLFQLGQPLLWARLHDMRRVIVGATRYIFLQAARTQGEQNEEVGFEQMASEGIIQQREMLLWFTQRARELGGKGGDAAVTVPTEQSGISRAWQFKTGEERMLFLITYQLEQVFNSVLDLVARQEGRNPEAISIKFNKTFDVDAGKGAIENAELIIDRATEFGLGAMVKVALRSMASALPNMTEDEQKAVQEEIDGLDVEAIAEEMKAKEEARTKALQEAGNGNGDGSTEAAD